MVKPEVLLGGRTRFAVLEALADAEKEQRKQGKQPQPMTAYQIAMTKGLDPAATYRCLAELSEFNIVESETRRQGYYKNNNNYYQTLYKLSKSRVGRAAAEFLRSLKKQQRRQQQNKTATTAAAPSVKELSIDLEKWISPEMRAKRMARIVRLDDQFNKSSSSLSSLLDERRARRRQNNNNNNNDDDDDIVVLVDKLLSKRISGELPALIASSRIAFNELFEQQKEGHGGGGSSGSSSSTGNNTFILKEQQRDGKSK